MNTFIFKLPEASADAYKTAAEILQNGGLVAFPTETVYGLGGNALDPQAAEKIYAAKGRPSDNPLIVHIAEIEQLEELVTDIPDKAKKLMDRFWPGPLTIILNKSSKVPLQTTGGLETVALRMPDHEVALSMIRKAMLPIAAPSANTSGRPSPTKAEHVIEDMDGRIECILDGGEVGIGVESTIVDLTSKTPYLLRPGYITKAMLEEVIGEVEIDPALAKLQAGEKLAEGVRPKAPGMKYRHYAPKAPLYLVQGEADSVRSMLTKLITEAKASGKRTAVICENKGDFEKLADVIYELGDRKDVLNISKKIYDVLRDTDKRDVDIIYSDDFGLETDTAFGYAVRNRLIKAAGGQVIEGGRDGSV